MKRLLALSIVLVAAAAAACGAGSLVAGPQPTSGGSGGIPACTNASVASYIGTSCSQEQGATVYHWSSYVCSSTPASICAALGPNGSNLQMEMDPNGPNTILVGRTSLWNVTAGESVDVVMNGSISGASSNLNWPHFNGLAGQSGDGTEENITTVDCASSGNCLDANNGVSDILCSATSPAANCTDQTSIGPYYGHYRATFNPAPAGAPYTLSIEIKLTGNTGSATLFAVGTHLTP